MDEHKSNAEEFKTGGHGEEFEPPEDDGELSESPAPLEKFKRFWATEATDLVDEYRSTSDSGSIPLAYDRLEQWDASLADGYVHDPGTIRKMAEKAVAANHDVDANVRLTDLPESRHFRVGDYRTRHLGTLIAVEGEVISVEDVTPLITTATFECRMCGGQRPVNQNYGTIITPPECHGPECGAGVDWKLIRSSSKLIDYQAVFLHPPDTTVDDPPMAPVYLRRDLVERVGKGDVITVVGEYDILPLSMQKEVQLDSFIEAHSLAVDENTKRGELKGEDLRERIIDYIEEHEDGSGAYGVDREEVVEAINEGEGVRETEIEEMIDDMVGSDVLDSGGRLMPA